MLSHGTGIIIPLAYPDTIVALSTERILSVLKYIGIGNKHYIRAGHAALVLIEKKTGLIEYYDFGRYIVPKSYGRVRGYETDCELCIPIKAKIEGDKINNIHDILKFLATQPKLTHGDGRLVASICHVIDYKKAKQYISDLQNKSLVKYAAFSKNASNCARFVTDTLIASVTDLKIRKRLKNSTWFTPSTVGNVLIADTQKHIFEVSSTGDISTYNKTKNRENLTCFFDKLKGYNPDKSGSLIPKHVKGLDEKAQWLSGIGSGAWFEIYKTNDNAHYRFRRISPYGHIDIDGVFKIDNTTFNYDLNYNFVYHSNCKFFHIEQNGVIFRFDNLKYLN